MYITAADKSVSVFQETMSRDEMKSVILHFLFYTVVFLSVVPSFSNTAVFKRPTSL